MKLHKLLVVAASVCLMAFLNVSSFAKGAADAPGLGARMAGQALEAQGHQVAVRGDVVEIETTDGLLVVDLPEEGVSTVTLDGVDIGAMDAGDLLNLSQCLDAVDLIQEVREAVCQLNVTELGDLICMTEAGLDAIMNDIYCLVQYVQATSE